MARARFSLNAIKPLIGKFRHVEANPVVAEQNRQTVSATMGPPPWGGQRLTCPVAIAKQFKSNSNHIGLQQLSCLAQMLQHSGPAK
jgi:hypothetical protein